MAFTVKQEAVATITQFYKISTFWAGKITFNAMSWSLFKACIMSCLVSAVSVHTFAALIVILKHNKVDENSLTM